MPTILIVDDEKNIRNHLATCIQDLGHAVETAADGDAAWRFLGARHFDLVLLDVHMPGLDGLGWLRRIRAKQPRVTVALMTAYATVPQAVEAMRLGACDYLMKPFGPDEVRRLIKRTLEGRGRRDEGGNGRTETAQREATEHGPGAALIPEKPEPNLPLREIERRCIEQAIETSPTLAVAAARLGIDPATLWRKRRRYGRV